MMRLAAIIFLVFTLAGSAGAQVNPLQISKEKEAMYTPYMYWRHGGKESLEQFKKEQPHEYLKELWYYCESWYVEKDYSATGVPLDLYVVDISRFEQYRKESELFYLVLPGYKDAIVLLPGSQLIYKPQ